MRYDFSVVLTGPAGQPVVTAEGDSTPWTAKAAIGNGLLTDSAENARTKRERYNLWRKLEKASPDTDYTAEEVVFLKEAAMTYSTYFAGVLVDILEQV